MAEPRNSQPRFAAGRTRNARSRTTALNRRRQLADTSTVPAAKAKDEQHDLDELEQQEQSLSAARRRLHDVIDFVRGLSPSERSPQGEQLRHLEGKELELSKRRRKLHGLIDALRGR
jgi:hypothetical protein